MKKVVVKSGRRKYPEFNDYFESTLKSFDLDKNWTIFQRKSFAGLSVLRNKNSHSSPLLTQSNIDKLNNLGLKDFIIDKVILLTPRMYYPVCEFAFSFLTELEGKLTSDELGEVIFANTNI